MGILTCFFKNPYAINFHLPVDGAPNLRFEISGLALRLITTLLGVAFFLESVLICILGLFLSLLILLCVVVSGSLLSPSLCFSCASSSAVLLRTNGDILGFWPGNNLLVGRPIFNLDVGLTDDNGFSTGLSSVTSSVFSCFSSVGASGVVELTTPGLPLPLMLKLGRGRLILALVTGASSACWARSVVDADLFKLNLFLLRAPNLFDDETGLASTFSTVSLASPLLDGAWVARVAAFRDPNEFGRWNLRPAALVTS